MSQANAALEVVFEKAWAKIDLEIRIAAIASLEQRCEAEVDELLRGPGGDWQRRAKEQAGAAIDSAGELQLRVAERLPPGRGGKSPLAEAEVTEEEIIRVAGLLPPEDPMHALLASASRDGVRAAPTAAGISQGVRAVPKPPAPLRLPEGTCAGMHKTAMQRAIKG